MTLTDKPLTNNIVEFVDVVPSLHQVRLSRRFRRYVLSTNVNGNRLHRMFIDKLFKLKAFASTQGYI